MIHSQPACLTVHPQDELALLIVPCTALVSLLQTITARVYNAGFEWAYCSIDFYYFLNHGTL